MLRWDRATILATADRVSELPSPTASWTDAGADPVQLNPEHEDVEGEKIETGWEGGVEICISGGCGTFASDSPRTGQSERSTPELQMYAQSMSMSLT